MDGCQKIATLLLALEPEVAADLLNRFEDEQKAEIVEAMLLVDYVDHASVEQVLGEFEQHCGQENHSITQPRRRAREIIERSLGEGDADAYLQQHDPGAHDDPYAALERLPVAQVVALLENEHPQAVATVLSRLPAAKAGELLSALPEDLSSDVVARMVHCEDTAPDDVVASIGEVLRERMAAAHSGGEPWATAEGRLQLVADALTAATRGARDSALKAVTAKNAQVGEQVRGRMFLFEDLVDLKADDLRKVVSGVDTQVVAMALKTASDEVREAIFGAVSKRAAASLREELDLLGPRPISEVEEAQRAIVDTVRRLQGEGAITIQRDAEEELV